MYGTMTPLIPGWLGNGLEPWSLDPSDGRCIWWVLPSNFLVAHGTPLKKHSAVSALLAAHLKFCSMHAYCPYICSY